MPPVRPPLPTGHCTLLPAHSTRTDQEQRESLLGGNQGDLTAGAGRLHSQRLDNRKSEERDPKSISTEPGHAEGDFGHQAVADDVLGTCYQPVQPYRNTSTTYCATKTSFNHLEDS